MNDRVEHYESVVESAYFDSESITYLLVTGSTREEVAAALGVDLDDERDPADVDDEGAAWSFTQIDGGILAMEDSGYADPAPATLRALSQGGRAAAVARSNIQGHDRFGAARNGETVFDDDEFVYVETLDEIPEQVRGLAALVWSDPAEEEADDHWPAHDILAVGLAMAEVVTGLSFDEDDTVRAGESGFFAGPSLVYARED